MTNEKPEKAQPFYKPEEALERIEALLTQNEEEGIVAVADIREITGRIVITGGTISLRGIKAGLVEALQRAEAANGQKLSGAHLFAYMNRGRDKIPLPTIEQALIELEREGVLHSDRSGALTVYGAGKLPTEEAKT